jgi:hypothetical protein
VVCAVALIENTTGIAKAKTARLAINLLFITTPSPAPKRINPHLEESLYQKERQLPCQRGWQRPSTTLLFSMKKETNSTIPKA